MTDELVSLRMLAVSPASEDRALLRSTAGAMSIPIDMLEAGNAGSAGAALARPDIDIVLIDCAVAATERATIVAAARKSAAQPFVILLAPSREEARQLSAGAGSDGVVIKPATPAQAKSVLERCVRVRLPSRILVVDDSSTTRSIVRKILSASRFRVHVEEADEGLRALRQIAMGRFDLVILDYNMPGFNGVETLSEIKRQQPTLSVVMITATPDEEVAERAKAAGAAAFLKKPFYPSDIDTVLCSVFGLRVQ